MPVPYLDETGINLHSQCSYRKRYGCVCRWDDPGKLSSPLMQNCPQLVFCASKHFYLSCRLLCFLGRTEGKAFFMPHCCQFCFCQSWDNFKTSNLSKGFGNTQGKHWWSYNCRILCPKNYKTGDKHFSMQHFCRFFFFIYIYLQVCLFVFFLSFFASLLRPNYQEFYIVQVEELQVQFGPALRWIEVIHISLFPC